MLAGSGLYAWAEQLWQRVSLKRLELRGARHHAMEGLGVREAHLMVLRLRRLVPLIGCGDARAPWSCSLRRCRGARCCTPWAGVSEDYHLQLRRKYKRSWAVMASSRIETAFRAPAHRRKQRAALLFGSTKAIISSTSIALCVAYVLQVCTLKVRYEHASPERFARAFANARDFANAPKLRQGQSNVMQPIIYGYPCS